MNILIIGAAGMVGSRLVTEAAARGHLITAAARNPAPGIAPSVHPLRLDASDSAQLRTAMVGIDSVILAVRAHSGQADGVPSITRAVLDATVDTGVRVLVIGGAGPLNSPRSPGLSVIDDVKYVPPQWRTVATISTRQLEACLAHTNQDWVYLSPPAILEPGVRAGTYQRGTTTLLTAKDGSSRISVEDLAIAALDEVESPGADQWITVAQR